MDLNEGLAYNASIFERIVRVQNRHIFGRTKRLFHHGHCNKKTRLVKVGYNHHGDPCAV